ncbi:MAG: hypothetical protein JO060_05495 [Candidatus Eremiobacteraeota bacterium]|nr:hypothetical protein [Candidatus Eremiobacteraeota bacterium]MBV9646542.1 hypothetical protein [Candidatus Eremiobacteraeota bacterium]
MLISEFGGRAVFLITGDIHQVSTQINAELVRGTVIGIMLGDISLPASDIQNLATRLKGASAIVIYGPGSERFHDIVDQNLYDSALLNGEIEQIQTGFGNDEDADNLVFDTLQTFDWRQLSEAGSFLFLSFGPHSTTAKLRQLLFDPSATVRTVVERD